jgi:hypothetical protein
MMADNTTISLTFGDAGENHTGMEMLGKLGKPGSGFTCDELKIIQDKVESAEYHDFGRDAGILIIRNFINQKQHHLLFDEMLQLEWDKKYFCNRRKKVLNKHARSNIMVLDGVEQQPDYENAKGRIVDTHSLQFLPIIKRMLHKLIGDKAQHLICEGNRYDDNTKNGIGFHGDTERRKVIALRLGAPMDIHWQWYFQTKPIEERFQFTVNGGDLYIMSEKAVGNDWKRRSVHTIRHAAGAKKYLKL